MESLVQQVVDKMVRDRFEPRLASLENRLPATGTRLDFAERLAKFELEMAAPKKGK